MDYQFCPFQCRDRLRRLAARTSAIDLVLLALLVAFGLGMCLTLAADAEVAFEERWRVPAGNEIVMPVSGSQGFAEIVPISKSRIKM